MVLAHPVDTGHPDLTLLEFGLASSVRVRVLNPSETDLTDLKRRLTEFEARMESGGQPMGHPNIIVDGLRKGVMHLTLAEYDGPSCDGFEMGDILGYNVFQRTSLVKPEHAQRLYSGGSLVPFNELTSAGFPSTYLQLLTNPSQGPEGRVGFLAYVVTAPEARGMNLSVDLIHATNDFLHASMGVEYSIAFGRITTPLQVSDDYPTACGQVNEFLKQRREDGLSPDHAVRFHQRAGAKVAAGVPYSTAHEHGFLAVYKTG